MPVLGIALQLVAEGGKSERLEQVLDDTVGDSSAYDVHVPS
jgi:hypothetical protein